MAGFRNSIPARAGTRFRKNLFSDHRTIRLMKLMASAMLSAAIETIQFSASFVTSLLASFSQSLCKGNVFCILSFG